MIEQDPKDRKDQKKPTNSLIQKPSSQKVDKATLDIDYKQPTDNISNTKISSADKQDSSNKIEVKAVSDQINSTNQIPQVTRSTEDQSALSLNKAGSPNKVDPNNNQEDNSDPNPPNPINPINYEFNCKNNVYFEAPKKINMIYYALLVLFISFISWAYFSEIEEITRGGGKVIPSSEVKVIQSLDGGIISKFYVKEGDLVQAGQILLKLEDTRFSANYNQSYTKLMSLTAETARLTAQLSFSDRITFPVILNNYPELKNSQTELFNKITSLYNKEKASLEQNIELSKQELEIVLPLVNDGLMSQLERIRLEKQLSEAKSKLTNMVENFKTTAEADLAEKQSTIISLQEKLKGLEDQMTRTEIIAPVSGYAHNFKFHTVGGVIKSGVDVLEIVPIEEQVVVEAKINPRDRAFIKKDQPAVVKFTAYDSSIYGGLEAKVISISPDTEKDEENNEFYLVRLMTEKNYVNDDTSLTIIPGMTADVNILTGKKRILHYLLKPVTRFKENALRER